MSEIPIIPNPVPPPVTNATFPSKESLGNMRPLLAGNAVDATSGDVHPPFVDIRRDNEEEEHESVKRGLDEVVRVARKAPFKSF